MSFGRSPKRRAAHDSTLPSLMRAFADQLALELSQAPKAGQHKATVRRGGVGPISLSDQKPGSLA